MTRAEASCSQCRQQAQGRCGHGPESHQHRETSRCAAKVTSQQLPSDHASPGSSCPGEEPACEGVATGGLEWGLGNRMSPACHAPPLWESPLHCLSATCLRRTEGLCRAASHRAGLCLHCRQAERGSQHRQATATREPAPELAMPRTAQEGLSCSPCPCRVQGPRGAGVLLSVLLRVLCMSRSLNCPVVKRTQGDFWPCQRWDKRCSGAPLAPLPPPKSHTRLL